MKKVDINDLTNITPLFNSENKFTSFASIKKTNLDGKTYIFKDFYEDKLRTRPFIRKYEALSEIDEESLVVPEILVVKDGKPYSYLTRYIENSCNINKLNNKKIKEQVKVLKSARDNLELLHSYGIVHADIHAGNILYDKNNTYYIDFDNCSYKGFKTIPSLGTDIEEEFVKKYGICKELDIAMFNLITFYLINNGIYFFTRRDIIKKNYGKFYDYDSIKICDNLLFQDDEPMNEYLIDTLKL